MQYKRKTAEKTQYRQLREHFEVVFCAAMRRSVRFEIGFKNLFTIFHDGCRMAVYMLLTPSPLTGECWGEASKPNTQSAGV
jgi:hypothetical protein